MALWMAAELMQSDPILHRVVKNETEAASYIERIVEKESLLVEIMGHVITNGRCIGRYNQWLQWNNILGILAPPFNIRKISGVNRNNRNSI
jgi:hypothetical protein